MAVKINNIEYSGFFFNGEALTAMYLNGNKVYGSEPQPVWTTSAQTISYTSLPSTFNVGDTHSLGASTSPTGGTLSYSSSNSSVATVDSNGIVTAVAEGNATITISVGAWDDNANHIHYASASTTVSVEVQEATPTPTSPVYFDASNPGNINIQTITDDGLSGVTFSRRGSKTVYFNVDSRIRDTEGDYRILTNDVNGKFYDPDGSLMYAHPTPSGVETDIWNYDDIGTYKLVMPGKLNAYTRATFQIIPPSS